MCVCVYTLTGLGSATLAGSETQEPPVSASHSSSYRCALAMTWLLPIPTQFPCLRSKHPTHRQPPWPFKVQNILSSLREALGHWVEKFSAHFLASLFLVNVKYTLGVFLLVYFCWFMPEILSLPLWSVSVS